MTWMTTESGSRACWARTRASATVGPLWAPTGHQKRTDPIRPVARRQMILLDMVLAIGGRINDGIRSAEAVVAAENRLRIGDDLGAVHQERIFVAARFDIDVEYPPVAPLFRPDPAVRHPVVKGSDKGHMLGVRDALEG